MKIAWKIEVPQWIILGAMFGAAALAWPQAPDRIPVHWNINGQVDRYGGRFEGLLVMPLVALGIYVLMLLLPRIDPGRANYARFRGAYNAIRIAMVAFFGVFDLLVRKSALNGGVGVGRVAPLAIGVMMIFLGAMLGKIRPNWFVGIRTPWTLSSKVAWVRTHRAGGWLFMLVGLATVLVSFVSARVSFWVLIVGIAAGTIGLVVYSYLLWRQDPDKIPPAGTLPAD